MENPHRELIQSFGLIDSIIYYLFIIDKLLGTTITIIIITYFVMVRFSAPICHFCFIIYVLFATKCDGACRVNDRMQIHWLPFQTGNPDSQ